MKMPCELIVTHILPTARGALAKELVHNHGMTQVQVANLFGVTSAAVSQYIKGLRGGNNLIDKSAYRDDFYKMIADSASQRRRRRGGPHRVPLQDMRVREGERAPEGPVRLRGIQRRPRHLRGMPPHRHHHPRGDLSARVLCTGGTYRHPS